MWKNVWRAEGVLSMRRRRIGRGLLWWLIVMVGLAAAATGWSYLARTGFAFPDEGYAMTDEGAALAEPSQALGYEAMNMMAQHVGHQDYNVCLLPNAFFEEACQPSGRQYLSMMTDSINLKFNYQLKTHGPLDYRYTHAIVGRLIVFDRDSREREIYNRQFVLRDNIYGEQLNTTLLNIDETYKLDFQAFNRQALEFKDSNGLGGEAVFVVEMVVDLTAEVESGRSITRQANMDFTVPLARQTYSVRSGRSPYQEELLAFVGADTSWVKLYHKVAIGVGLVVLVIAAGVAYQKYRSRPKDLCDRYDIKMHKEYGRIIVDLKTSLRINDYKHRYEVAAFEDLVDKADRVMQNILCFKLPSGRTIYAVVEGNHIFLHGCPHWSGKIIEKPNSGKGKS
jgi:hypothetical protein